ncbi:MAG: aminotransferase class IV [Formosa sp.]|jgi:branched-chain amino acid aminotransferase|nr:aminotransferase class IV [Formosa sp.]|tara:strand:+ start:13094 stop:13936 length:843 start_codon:yes stop_codon:yes gene_type:complete
MININGTILEDSEAYLSVDNRGFSYGDAVFETIKVNSKPLFWEVHYFRLMASMRILRMEIPMHFTPEFLESQIMDLVDPQSDKAKSYRIKLTVFRATGGYYTPTSNSVKFIITLSPLDSDIYNSHTDSCEIELFKDYFIAPNLLSTLKTNNKAINVVGSIFAKENNYDNCLLLNTNKNIIEALNGNVFLVKDNVIKTPPLADGCLKGIIRDQLIDMISKSDNYDLIETSISPFELQKADEIFITNVIQGIKPVTKFRKKTYTTEVAKKFQNKLNIKLRLG